LHDTNKVFSFVLSSTTIITKTIQFMTATAQTFISLFQTLPPSEQQAVCTWIDDHKSDLEKGIVDAAFAPMSKEEENEFWQAVNAHSLFNDWSEEENEIWTKYVHELDNQPQIV
jgi:hypothetical protein